MFRTFFFGTYSKFNDENKGEVLQYVINNGQYHDQEKSKLNIAIMTNNDVHAFKNVTNILLLHCTK